MNQEKVGEFIKNIRKKEGLTQEKFAQKYGVTYQAVSKWENGKNIPDIAILKEICNDYHQDLNDLLEGKEKTSTKKRQSKKLIYFFIIILFIIGFILFMVLYNNNNDFHFKKISTTCDNFNLYGSIAYNDNKTSIYISDITYCGEEDENKYIEISCSLYELDDKIKTNISKYHYKETEAISLEAFLEKVNFNIDHYAENCKMYQENGLYIEIEAKDINNQITYYKIPLKLEENCS